MTSSNCFVRTVCKIPGSDFSNSYKCKEEWLKLQTEYQNGKENYEVREQKTDLCMAYEKKEKKSYEFFRKEKWKIGDSSVFYVFKWNKYTYSEKSFRYVSNSGTMHRAQIEY